MRHTQFGEGKTDRQKERLWDGSFPMTRSQSTLHTLRLRNEKREKKKENKYFPRTFLFIWLIRMEANNKDNWFSIWRKFSFNYF